MIEPWQRIAAKQPIAWLGDLDDDCTAKWAGFTLRAEWMDDDLWWWAVIIDATGEQFVTSNNDRAKIARNGAEARAAAELAAHQLLGLAR